MTPSKTCVCLAFSAMLFAGCGVERVQLADPSPDAGEASDPKRSEQRNGRDDGQDTGVADCDCPNESDGTIEIDAGPRDAAAADDSGS